MYRVPTGYREVTRRLPGRVPTVCIFAENAPYRTSQKVHAPAAPLGLINGRSNSDRREVERVVDEHTDRCRPALKGRRGEEEESDGGDRDWKVGSNLGFFYFFP